MEIGGDIDKRSVSGMQAQGSRWREQDMREETDMQIILSRDLALGEQRNRTSAKGGVRLTAERLDGNANGNEAVEGKN